MRVENLTVQYAGKSPQIEGLHTVLPKGKITTIIGPNGCGKSTLLHALTRQLTPVAGTVFYEQQAISQLSAKQFAQRVAVVFQQNQAPQELTVKQLVEMGRLPYQNLFSSPSSEDEEAVQWALERTNLWARKEAAVTSLSGGERQRVWLAMALAQRTGHLFLDEPTTYLDLFYQYELLQLIQSLNREEQLTIVMVLHDLNQAYQYSDHVIMMKDGKIYAEGTPQEVLTDSAAREVYGVQLIQYEDEKRGTYLVSFPLEEE